MEVMPTANSRWMHMSGDVYTVICVADVDAQNPEKYPATVFFATEVGFVWSSPLADFLKDFIEVDKKESE